MREVRIFARLGDGSLRVAMRQSDQPGWAWPMAGDVAQHLAGDVVLTVNTVGELPHGPGEITGAMLS